MSKVPRIILIVFILSCSYVFITNTISLINSTATKSFVISTLNNERTLLTNQLFQELSLLNEKLSNLTKYNQLLIQFESEKKHEFLKKYPNFLECKNNNLTKWSPNSQKNSLPQDYEKINFNLLYSQPAPNETHDTRTTRAIILYFPIEKQKSFFSELKWLYRSWINMQRYEPSKWRTDLIIFIDHVKEIFDKKDFELNQLNCTFGNKRVLPTDRPMCTLIKYKSLKSRNLTREAKTPDYDIFLDKINIFSDDVNELKQFYSLLSQNLISYSYLDSILMAFEGYQYFKSAGYDFLVRSDMDVFLTPMFAKWMPKHCNDFIVGGGGYSSNFNRKRFRRVAKNLGFNYPNVGGLGSTWYSTPDQFRLVSYLTLFGMAYLSAEEFSEPERQGKVGTILWPDWHYGVLLLYGQNLALNHLIGSNELNIVKLNNLIDYPTGNAESVNTKLHLHVYHGDKMFSKFAFRAGRYDNLTVADYEANSTETRFYALKMALESKRTTANDLFKKFNDEILIKKD